MVRNKQWFVIQKCGEIGEKKEYSNNPQIFTPPLETLNALTFKWAQHMLTFFQQNNYVGQVVIQKKKKNIIPACSAMRAFKNCQGEH